MSEELDRTSDLERGLRRLEAIVERLERDELGLDEALRLFDEGMALLRAADRRLSESEGRLKQVLMDRQGRSRLVDLDLPG
jgi:exodeoxyribonuclease VII small subunit